MTLPAATITATNILVGKADLYIGKNTPFYGTYAAPLADTDMEYMGATDGGVDLTNNNKFDNFDVYVDQQMARIKQVPTKSNEDITLKTNLSEATLKNIARAWGYPDSAVTPPDSFFFGSPGNTTPNYRQIVMVGVGPSSKTRTVTLYKATIAQSGAMSHKKDGTTLIPIEITAYNDDNAAAGYKKGKIVDAA